MTDNAKKEALAIISVMRGIAMQSSDSAAAVSIQAKLTQLERIIKG